MRPTFADIAKTLAPEILAAVKSSDPDPTLAVCRVAREGPSSGGISGVGKAVKRWSRDRVAELAALMDGSLAPVYRGHANPGGPRKSVGKIVGCVTKLESGRLSAFATIHITDDKTATEAIMKNLDTASIEADVTIEKNGDALDVASVEKVTGLAIGSSAKNAPGFKDARIVAAVRESDDESETQGGGASDGEAAKLADEFLATKNLNPSERGYVRRRVLARLGETSSERAVKAEASSVLADLAEAKSIYRKPGAPPKPAPEKTRGPFDYGDPAHNDLIP